MPHRKYYNLSFGQAQNANSGEVHPFLRLPQMSDEFGGGWEETENTGFE